MKAHIQQYARSEYHTQLAKMSFDKIFDLTAGVCFNFYNTSMGADRPGGLADTSHSLALALEFDSHCGGDILIFLEKRKEKGPTER